MTGVGVVVAAAVYWLAGSAETVDSDIENPFRLRPALFFGVVFAVVLLVSEHAREWFGASGVYATAFRSGLADVDAITITLSRLSGNGAITREVATTGIVVGAVANTLVKAGLTWVLGTRELALVVTAVVGEMALALYLVVNGIRKERSATVDGV